MPSITAAKPPVSKTYVIAAATIGTALEFYDFAIYSFFSIQIGKLFFPQFSSISQFLLSIAVFGVGFVIRPIGGVVIGAYADRVGRKKAMVLTIMLMAISCALIACAPPYSVAGVAAPIIVLIARLVQGFAAGGEFGPGTTLLMEYATDKKRAFFASWNFAATALGLVFGSIVATLINTLLDKDLVASWGWRLPFLLGIVAAPLGSLIRTRLEETLIVDAAGTTARQPAFGALKAVLTKHLDLTMVGTLAELGGSVSVYITAFFLPAHAIRTLHMSSTHAAISGVVSSLVLFLSAPIMGYLADRFSRKRVLLISRCAMIIVVYPAFLLLSMHPTLIMLCGVSAVLAVLVTGQIIPVLVMIPEMFPTNVRATGIAMTYVVSASIFGGFSPLIAAVLTARSGNPLAPAWYVAAACLMSLFALIWLRDRTGEKLT
ncbi:major facilitator transporter [Robbsia andropogonis]|uniref:Major facilitator transporter n=1 Tax=Robbsia andropogonis TaxID=28092 RepID=A0A0F5JYC9_9BURK|nr:MFS transporter [Robbsia andropogonis]KKB62838.1 major facilitator transporter [Robbsia andropogonis]MCP1118089.1 MFS transporter [Robbsia andropogonis]MCP1127630.1 MFS transporter [Robbsia andropogonis]